MRTGSFFLLLSLLLITSCGEETKTKPVTRVRDNGVDRVTVHEYNPYDTATNKVIYQTAWGNTADSLKPVFDIHFCRDSFQFPYYFPANAYLTGKPGQTITAVENISLSFTLRTNYEMSYDEKGRIKSYKVSGPSAIYSCSYRYDDGDRIIGIEEGTKKIAVTYTDTGLIESITAAGPGDVIIRSLRFTYSYVAFPGY